MKLSWSGRTEGDDRLYHLTCSCGDGEICSCIYDGSASWEEASIVRDTASLELTSAPASSFPIGSGNTLFSSWTRMSSASWHWKLGRDRLAHDIVLYMYFIMHSCTLASAPDAFPRLG